MSPKLLKHPDLSQQSDLLSASGDTYAHEFDAPRMFVIKGTNGKDVLDGNMQAEHMYGLAGNDELLGNGGNDYLEGGSGDDYLNGGVSTDKLYGGAGNDALRAGEQVYGGAGNDFLSGFGDVRLFGGTGNDRFDHYGKGQLFGGAGRDEFFLQGETVAAGCTGNDRFVIEHERPTARGGAGFDVVAFQVASKYFKASYENDFLLLRAKTDTIYKPQYLADDPTTEKIVWKDFELTFRLKSDPTISSIIAWGTVEEGGTATAPLSSISGEADPFARIKVMADGVVLGTCVTDHNGAWQLTNFYGELPDGAVGLTAVADYGANSAQKTSESYDFVVDLPDAGNSSAFETFEF